VTLLRGVAVSKLDTQRLVVVVTPERVFLEERRRLADVILRENKIDAVVEVASMWREVLGALNENENRVSSSCSCRNRDDPDQSPLP